MYAVRPLALEVTSFRHSPEAGLLYYAFSGCWLALGPMAWLAEQFAHRHDITDVVDLVILQV